MGIIDRIILSVYTFLLAFLSVVVILISFHLVSADIVKMFIGYIDGQWEAGLVGAIFLLLSIRLLLAGLRRRTENGKDAIVHHSEMGDVQITLEAVKNLVEKTVRHTRGVRGVKVHVTNYGQELKVSVKAVVSPESHVPSVSVDIQKRVHEYIKNTVGVDLVDIHVLVDNISNDFKSKHRVE